MTTTTTPTTTTTTPPPTTTTAPPVVPTTTVYRPPSCQYGGTHPYCNPPPPPPELTVTGPTVDEDAGSAIFTIRLSHVIQNRVYVDVDTSDGTATAGDDYTAVNRRVYIEVNYLSVSVSVPIIDDSSSEPDETFTLTLSNPSRATLTGTPEALATIRDDDIPPPDAVQNLTLTCTATSISPAEFELSATWDAPTNGAVRVQAEITDQANVRLLAISASATSPYTTTVTTEGTYRAGVLPYLTGGNLGVPSEAFGDCAISEISVSGPGTVDEGQPLTYTVSLSPATQSAVTVGWATTSTGTATDGRNCNSDGVDYISDSGTVRFAAGQGTKTVQVGTCSDAQSPESSETVAVRLSNANGADIGTGTATGTIRDVPPPQVSLDDTPLTVDESNAAGVQVVALLDKLPSGSASVSYRTLGSDDGNGSCSAGASFYLDEAAFVFNGTDRLAITLHPCDDADTSDETITFRLTTIGISGLQLGSPTTVEVIITDDDTADCHTWQQFDPVTNTCVNRPFLS